MLTRVWIVLFVFLFFTGCKSQFEPNIHDSHKQMDGRSAEAKKSLDYTQVKNEPFVSVTSIPKFTRGSIPISRTSMLPSNINKVTFRYIGRYNLSSIADIVSRKIKIPIVLTPDALLDPRVFTPVKSQSSGTQQAQTSINASTSNLLADVSKLNENMISNGADRMVLTDEVASNSYELNYQGSLSGLLDEIASKAQLLWEYKDGKITFKRVITRVISVKALPGSVKSTGTLKISSGDIGDTNVNSEIDLDYWASLEKALPLFISSMGSVFVDSRLGLITVRDAFSNVKEIENFISQSNKQLLSQVSLKVEVIQIDLSFDHQSGIDWNVVANTINGDTISLQGAPLLSTATTSTSSGGGLVLNNAKLGSTSVTASFLYRALEQFGKISTSYSTVVTTSNRQSVPVGLVNSLSYLKQTTPSVTTGTTGVTNSVPGLTPGTVNTGFTLSLLPVILDSNRILLQCAINISSLRELTSFSSGTGATLQTIQTPNIDSYASVQRVNLNAGDTVAIVGYDKQEARSSANDVMQIPGSKAGSTKRVSTVIIITPIILDI
jgi:type IVB pilus formation R64 PilN family outer membrane protein